MRCAVLNIKRNSPKTAPPLYISIYNGENSNWTLRRRTAIKKVGKQKIQRLIKNVLEYKNAKKELLKFYKILLTKEFVSKNFNAMERF